VGSILVYPSTVYAAERRAGVFERGSLVVDAPEALLGEAHRGGPVILAWDAVTRGARDPDDGRSVVIHEFAHKIDMLKGEATGVPPFLPAFHRNIDGRAFATALSNAHAAFAAEVARWEMRGGGEEEMPILDPYAAENPVEFFAVLSEAFFTAPQDVADDFPELYRLFVRYYRQDPLG
jgi:hypothetical protein